MPQTILIADDDTDSVAPLHEKLAFDGHGVVTAETGKQALQAFQQHPVDLVLLDLMEPDMDGLQVCRQIRSASAVPIIILSATQGVAEKVLLLEGGADDYVAKPFDYPELAARIQVRMRRSLNFVLRTSQAPVQIGPLTLHPHTRRVAYNGRSVKLTHKEYDILKLLSQHVDQVTNRRTIRKALWTDACIYSWSRAIDVHIQHIRQKLEDNPSAPQLIRTVKGAGYMLCLKPAKGGYPGRIPNQAGDS